MNEVERGREGSFNFDDMAMYVGNLALITPQRKAALEKVAEAVAEYKRCPEPGRWHKVEAALSKLDQEE